MTFQVDGQPLPSTEAIATGSGAFIAQELRAMRIDQEEEVQGNDPQKQWGTEQVTEHLHLDKVLSDEELLPSPLTPHWQLEKG